MFSLFERTSEHARLSISINVIATESRILSRNEHKKRAHNVQSRTASKGSGGNEYRAQKVSTEIASGKVPSFDQCIITIHLLNLTDFAVPAFRGIWSANAQRPTERACVLSAKIVPITAVHWLQYSNCTKSRIKCPFGIGLLLIGVAVRVPECACEILLYRNAIQLSNALHYLILAINQPYYNKFYAANDILCALMGKIVHFLLLHLRFVLSSDFSFTLTLYRAHIAHAHFFRQRIYCVRCSSVRNSI